MAACPGGNIPNFMSMNAEGNTALSVTLTAVATVRAIVLTPLNLSFWGGLYSPAASILTSVDVSFGRVFKTLTLILGVPLVLGMTVRRMVPERAQRLSRWMQALSILLFAGIVLFALRANFEYLVGHVGVVFDLVLIHNAVALAAGYQLAYWTALSTKDRQTLALETSIQNPGFGLILDFYFHNSVLNPRLSDEPL